MKPITGHFQIDTPALPSRVAQPMQIPFQELLEHTKSEQISARIWRFPPRSANTWHKHIKAEELYFVLEGIGRMRVGDQTLTVPKHSAVLVGPDQMRQVFNDTDSEVLWLIVAAPENELEPGETFDIKKFWPEDPKQLPQELAGIQWPPPVDAAATSDKLPTPMSQSQSPIFQHIYASSAAQPFSTEDLLALLKKSRDNNSSAGVTGMLLYKGGNFLQVLEGGRDSVQKILAKISADPRHKGMVRLLEGEIPKRQFADWSMGFRNLDSSEVRETPGFNEFMNESLQPKALASDPSRAKKLLELFRTSMR